MRIIESKKKSKIPGGLADKRNPEDFDKDQLKKGIKVEMEHTNDKELAEEISMDHLAEDPKYYDHLDEMEKKYKKKAGVNMGESYPNYSMDQYQEGMIVEFIHNGQPIRKKIILVDSKNGRIAVRMGGKTIGIPESRVKLVDEDSGKISDIKLPDGNFRRIETSSIFNLTKQAKKKKNKWNPNPWSVCHTTCDKDEDPEKYERCVKKVKKNQKKSISGKVIKTSQDGRAVMLKKIFKLSSFTKITQAPRLIKTDSEIFTLPADYGELGKSKIKVVYDVYENNIIEIRSMTLKNGKDVLHDDSFDDFKYEIEQRLHQWAEEEDWESHKENESHFNDGYPDDPAALRGDYLRDRQKDDRAMGDL